ncbi:hypothetical protein [Amycolatopsis sp. cmx-11-12]|uniref:hypothetical protein n=1 Tax=Amycolatopsis sp. cmx-11-12 TaxID=2785795 RepID=UPI003917FA70
MDIPLREAVSVANNLVSARLRQFEYTSETELPEAAARLNLNDTERAELAKWVEGAKDYLSGILAWHIKAGRYCGRSTDITHLSVDTSGPCLGFGQ